MNRKVDRLAVLDKASEIISNQGVTGLSMRGLAKALDCSTMVLYSNFENKEDLLAAVFLEGSNRLSDRFKEVIQGDNPLEDLRLIGITCRQNAMENPHYYEMMNGVTAGLFKPGEAAEQKVRECREMQASLIRACQNEGIFQTVDPETILDTLWTVTHGFINLELSGYFSSKAVADERFETTIKATARGFFTPEFLMRLVEGPGQRV